MFPLPIFSVGNHGLGPTLAKVVSDGLTIIGLVACQGFKTGSLSTGFAANGDRIEQGIDLSGFMLLAWGDGDGNRLTRPFTKHMDFGCKAPATSPKTLSFKAFFTVYRNTVDVFFAPAAALCARTTLPSRAPKVKSI